MASQVKTLETGKLLPRRFRDMQDGTFAEKVIAGGITPVATAQLSKPADVTQYTAGDHIANSLTGSAVVPIEFTVASYNNSSGRITGARCTIVAASGTNLVLPNFDMLIFRPVVSIPFAAAGFPADNGVMNITGAAMKELVGVLSFVDSGWRNQLGGATAAGLVAYQSTSFVTRSHAPYNLVGLSSVKLVAVLQDRGAWNPGNVAYTFDFSLDVDSD